MLLEVLYGILRLPLQLLRTLMLRPRLDRDWSADQDRLPTIERDGRRVTVRNVRHCEYRSESDYTPRWEDRSYDLDSLRRVWFAVEPLSEWRGVAHTLLSFEFGKGRFLAISIEVRRPRGMEFSIIGGLMRRFELMYVFADERDVIRLRTDVRNDPVHLYPMRATPEQAQRLFLDMCRRANRLARRPEFYNTFTSNCATNIVGHVNRIWPNTVPLSFSFVLPGFSDLLAFDLGLIETDTGFEATRERWLINPRARGAGADYSRAIRE